jgi:hypothetical protein
VCWHRGLAVLSVEAAFRAPVETLLGRGFGAMDHWDKSIGVETVLSQQVGQVKGHSRPLRKFRVDLEVKPVHVPFGVNIRFDEQIVLEI